MKNICQKGFTKDFPYQLYERLHVFSNKIITNSYLLSTGLNSTDKNVKIARSNVIIWI